MIKHAFVFQSTKRDADFAFHSFELVGATGEWALQPGGPGLFCTYENVETDPYDSGCEFSLRGDCCRGSTGSGGNGEDEERGQGKACICDGFSDS